MRSACDEASILLKEKNLEVSSMISKKKKKKKKEIWDVKYISNIFTQKEKKKKNLVLHAVVLILIWCLSRNNNPHRLAACRSSCCDFRR